MKSYRFIISGRVQGVWYRKNVQQNALRAGFSGYIKNLPDGRVEAAVTCEEPEVTAFIALLREGSPLSRVTDIEQTESDMHFNGGFEVR
jgi:acylphosphatase